MKFGEETGPVVMPDYGAYRFTRVAGPTPEAPDVYSPVQAGWVSPANFESTERPIWTPLAIEAGRRLCQRRRPMASRSAPSLRRTIRRCWCSTANSRRNPSIPMFLEPECGLAWYDSGRKNLELVLGVQSPYEAAEALAYLLGKRARPFKPARINAQFAYMGGGFGGRDHTPFPLYVALAAMFFPGRPVRLAHDRYQQFQGGIKRHAFKMRTRIGVDRATGKISAFAADHVLDGGGLANFSATVATVGAVAAIGIYDIPKVDVTTVALHSRGVTAGSMRGYGTLQTMTALEVLIDEAAAALPLDPIEFRRRNALKTGGKTMTGNPYSVSVRTPEILDKIEKHPIWQQRARRKRAGSRAGSSSAPASPAPPRITARGADCSLGTVEIDPQGRIAIHGDHVDMGNGIGTALANRVAAHLGGVADEVTVHEVDSYGPLALVTSGDSRTMNQATQDAAAEKSALGAGDQHCHLRLERRACRHAGGGRGRARHIPLRFVAGGARPVGHRADRSDGQAMGGRALERRTAGDAGLGAAGVARDRRQSPCAQFRDRGHGARLLPLGVVAGDLPDRRTDMDAPISMRWPCARAAANTRASIAPA